MEWKSLKECYRACLPLNLPAEAGLIYRSSNNMCPQFPGSPFFSILARSVKSIRFRLIADFRECHKKHSYCRKNKSLYNRHCVRSEYRHSIVVKNWRIP